MAQPQDSIYSFQHKHDAYSYIFLAIVFVTCYNDSLLFSRLDTLMKAQKITHLMLPHLAVRLDWSSSVSAFWRTENHICISWYLMLLYCTVGLDRSSSMSAFQHAKDCILILICSRALVYFWLFAQINTLHFQLRDGPRIVATLWYNIDQFEVLLDRLESLWASKWATNLLCHTQNNLFFSISTMNTMFAKCLWIWKGLQIMVVRKISHF